MFVCHTPPFRTRRRSLSRDWRTCSGTHTLPNRPRTGPHVVAPDSVETVYCPVEAEFELEDVGSEYCFCRAIPGIPPEELQVAIEGPTLTVKTLTEIPGRRFEWRLAIPQDVSNDCITAEVKDGVLNVRLPKIPPRMFPVTGDDVSVDLWKLEHWGSEYRLTHPAPGVQASDVVVKVADGFLFVKVNGPNGRFSREVSVPPAVDVDAILVDIQNNMLVVTLPKIEREEIRIHRRSASGVPSTSSTFNSEEDDLLYNEARQVL